MENKDCAKIMIDLCQLDIDAVGAYDIALKHIDSSEIHTKITQYKEDHVHHITNLSNLIKTYGGEPPTTTPDLKGYLIAGMTALKSSTGLLGALKAMKTNEVTTNTKYKEALDKNPDLPADVITLLQKNLNDEKTHLSYIEATIPKVEEAHN